MPDQVRHDITKHMPEPLPQPTAEIPKPQTLVVGETLLYLTIPQKIGDTEIQSLTILPADKRANDGVGSIVPLVKEVSRKKGQEGLMVDKPLTNLNNFDEISWDKISGLQWTDESGASHVISKDEFALSPSEKAVASGPAELSDAGNLGDLEKPREEKIQLPEKAPILPTKEARDVLATLSEDPNTITIVGLKAYETRALDLADRSMQKLASPKAQERAAAANTLFEKVKDNLHGIHEFVFTNIWKQSVGGIYFHEKSRQYYMDMLKAAETPFAEDAIRLAERRATDMYNRKLTDATFLVRAGTKTVDWLKDKIGMRTTIQTLALQEMSSMKAAGEIKGADTFEREAKAIRARFGQDYERADQFVRKQLGEKLAILDPKNTEHAPLVEGIQSLLKEWVRGDIPDKAAFENRTKEFFNSTLKNVRPDIFAEAELYSSSLFDAAETLRIKNDHLGGMLNIDQAMAGMQIRLGLGSMGEVTSLEPTAIEKGVGKVREIAEWLNKKNVIVPLVLNEAAIGSGIAIALSAANFVKTMPARALIPLGGGALAGGLFAGWKEYGQLHKDYLTHLREKESGSTFTEMQKRRSWFERFAPQQRSASEMITTLQSSLYEQGAVKTTLSDNDVRSVFATVADLQARKAVSETGPKRIGLIRFSNREAIESERSALDLTANKALMDIETYLTAHAEQAETLLGGNTFPDFMVKLTTAQTQTLREGVGVLESLDDPIKATLGMVSSYAPEAALVKRRWPLASRTLTADEKAFGLDTIMEEFKKEARIEATKYGIKAGIIGAAVGAAIHEIGDVFAHRADIGETFRPSTESPTFTEVAAAPSTGPIPLQFSDPTHTAWINGHQYTLPDQLVITDHTIGSPDVALQHTYSAAFNTPDGQHIAFGDNLSPSQLEHTLEKAGFTLNEGHVAEQTLNLHDTIIPMPTGTDVPAKLPDGWEWKFADASHGWQLVDSSRDPAHQLVASGIHFDANGHLDGKELSELSKQLQRQFSDKFTIENPNPPQVTALPGEVSTAPDISTNAEYAKTVIPGSEMTNGTWQYFLDRAHGENSMATTNGMKNLLRVYLHDHPDAIEIPGGSPNEGFYSGGAHMRPATFGTLGEIREISAIPSDAEIHLPAGVFDQHGIDTFAKINSTAIERMNAMIASGEAKGPMDAITKLSESRVDDDKVAATVLRLGYVGQDHALPTDEADLNLLYEKLGATASVSAPGEAPTVPTASVEPFTISITEVQSAEGAKILASNPAGTVEFHYMTPEFKQAVDEKVAELQSVPTIQGTEQGIDSSDFAARHPDLSEMTQATSEGAVQKEAPWIPIFIPYREVLEAAPGEIISTAPKQRESLLSPFGMEDSFLTKESLEARKSPRLTEKSEAILNQREEISWYLTTLTPEESQTLESLNAQNLPPIAPKMRAIVTLPTSPSMTNIYQRLSTYVGQTNADGTPVDPKKTEFIIFDAHVAPPEGSVADADARAFTKTEVDRFISEHPDMAVRYITNTYPDMPTNGRIKRDVTNFALSRIATVPENTPDITVITDPGTTQPISSAYISSVIDTMDATPTIDLVSGNYTLPQEAYEQFPMLFAQHRAFEIMDSLVRHGDTGSVPGVYNGNIGVRASTLAGIGGYNPAATHAEDREIAWVIRSARGNSDTMAVLPNLTATIDPQETVYAHLQQMGLAEPTVPLMRNETYKDMSWTDMAKKANDSYTKEQLETHLTGMYDRMYPSLKADNPERFDAYFKRTMDALGLPYEISGGSPDGAASKITILDTANLAANIAAPMDIEAFAKTEAPAIVSATPKAPETPREELAAITGTPEPTETPSEQVSTPDNEPKAPSISSPEVIVTETPSETASTITVEEPKIESTPAPTERLPEGVEDRIKYVINKSKETSAAVQLTPGELMDYLKSSVDIAGTRITEGKIMIEGANVKLMDMKADVRVGVARLGEATFAGTLLTDPQKGLTVDQQSLKMKLPWTLKPLSKTIHQQLDDFNGLVLTHLNGRIDQNWKADRIDIVGDKLQVSLAKKT